MKLKQIAEIWDIFWFKPSSVLPVALLRIGFGLLSLLWCALMYPEVTVFFGQHRMVPIATAYEWYRDSAFDLFAFLPASDSSAYAMLALTAVAALGLTIGLATRACALVLFLCYATFANASPLIMNSGDTFARVISFLLIFAPSGKMLSVDAALSKRLRKQSAETIPRSEFGDVLHPRWVTRLIQLQLAGVYYQTFWSKMEGATWLNGTAVYYSSRLVEFKRFAVPYIFDHWWTLHALTWGTLVIECALFSLIWVKEFRYWVLLSAIFMHVAIDWTMNIPLFEWIMMTSYLAFVDGDDIHRAMAFVRRLLSRTTGQASVGST